MSTPTGPKPPEGGNSTTIWGVVHKYPAEVRTAPGNGDYQVMSFGVAYLQKFKSGKEFTNFFKVQTFKKDLFALAPSLVAGTPVIVQGSVGMQFPNPQVPNDTAKLRIDATAITIIGGFSQARAEAPQSASRRPPPMPADDEDKEVPF